MEKYTKIVATLGPVSDTEEMMEKLIKAGANIFRFNFKHSTVEWHLERILRAKKVAARMGKNVGILLDFQGADIRINLKGDLTEISFEAGEALLFGQESLTSDEKGFTISHPDIIKHITDGHKVIADDGAFTFKLNRKDGKTYLVPDNGGTLKMRKSLNIPGADFPFPILTQRDYDGFKLAVDGDVDYIAISFVRTKEDMLTVRKEMENYKVRAKLISKIEAARAIDNLDDIIELSDALMVARGDLGVELPMHEVPYYQKVMIKKCVEKGIPVITATQMLQSMIENSAPTRAEVSDVANACYDLTDAVMLSAETAGGKYPEEAVKVQADTAKFNEKKFVSDRRLRFDYEVNTTDEIIANGAYDLYLHSMSRKKLVVGFIVFSESGRTVRLISRYRPLVPIYAFGPKEITGQLALSFGVQAFVQEEVTQKAEFTKGDVQKAMVYLKEKGLVEKGNKLIVLHGDNWSEKGGTTTVKVVTVA